MFVCKKCHEQDRAAIKCGERHEEHLISIVGECAVCGEYSNDLRWCGSYKYVKESHG